MREPIVDPAALAAHREAIAARVLEFFPKIFRQSSGTLRRPYLSPGGPYACDLWDWDSYWVAVALLRLAERGRESLREEAAPFLTGALFNFYDHQGEDGSIPIMMSPDDDDWFDCKTSADHNQAKPFLGQFTHLLYRHNLLPKQTLRECFYHVSRFHQCWIDRCRDERTGLFFWASDLGLGVDDDPTAWGRPPKSCGNVFLNTFLYMDFRAAAELAAEIRRPDLAEEAHQRADALAEAIRRYCYDPREKAYFSVDLQCRRNIVPHRYWGRLNEKLTPFWHCLPLKILSWGSLLPIWAGIGGKQEADDFVRHHLVPERLLSPYGVRALSRDERMYAPEVDRGNPSNWLGGLWTVPNFLVVDTLRRYGHTGLADRITADYLGMLVADLERTGTFHEYYSPETGEPVCGPDFLSWTALAATLGEDEPANRENLPAAEALTRIA